MAKRLAISTHPSLQYRFYYVWRYVHVAGHDYGLHIPGLIRDIPSNNPDFVCSMIYVPGSGCRDNQYQFEVWRIAIVVVAHADNHDWSNSIDLELGARLEPSATSAALLGLHGTSPYVIV